MTSEKVLVTQQGLNELLKEQEHLIHVVRKEIIQDLQNARAQGDLSENADYDAARDRQARVEARIQELEIMLNNIELIDDKKKGSKSKLVKLGATVKILDLEDEIEEEYVIVGSVESDPLKGRLSNVTPLAEAILDCKVGDIVTVSVDEPYQVKILEIK